MRMLELLKDKELAMNYFMGLMSVNTETIVDKNDVVLIVDADIVLRNAIRDAIKKTATINDTVVSIKDESNKLLVKLAKADYALLNNGISLKESEEFFKFISDEQLNYDDGYIVNWNKDTGTIITLTSNGNVPVKSTMATVVKKLKDHLDPEVIELISDKWGCAA